MLIMGLKPLNGRFSIGKWQKNKNQYNRQTVDSRKGLLGIVLAVEKSKGRKWLINKFKGERLRRNLAAVSLCNDPAAVNGEVDASLLK
jgi:hypothetical protein